MLLLCLCCRVCWSTTIPAEFPRPAALRPGWVPSACFTTRTESWSSDTTRTCWWRSAAACDSFISAANEHLNQQQRLRPPADTDPVRAEKHQPEERLTCSGIRDLGKDEEKHALLLENLENHNQSKQLLNGLWRSQALSMYLQSHHVVEKLCKYLL